MKILVTIEVEDKVRSDFLTKTHSELLFVPRNEVTESLLKEVDAVVGNLSASLLNSAPHLQWVHLESAGADQYAHQLNPDIQLTNSTGAYGHAIAEHMIAGVFYFYKKIDHYAKNQKDHLWINRGRVDSVQGSTVVIVGYGDIGQAFGQRMKALGCHIIGVKRTPSVAPFADQIVTMNQLTDVLCKADIIALALPSTPETHKIIRAETLRHCKKEAVLINVGRGVTMDTDGLCQVLDEGWFKGVMLDVTDPEPLPINHPLWRYENVLITPHVSGNYNLLTTYQHVIDIAIENINHFENKEPLINLVDRKTGYKKTS